MRGRPRHRVFQEAASLPRLGSATQLARKSPGLTRCFTGLRQVTDPRLLRQAHQKSGSFPPPALPGFSGTMTLSDTHLCRRLSAPLRPLPSPMMGLPSPDLIRGLAASPFQRAVPTTPADRDGCACRLLPRSRGLPRYAGGSASASSLSRPAQASLALRPAGSQPPKAALSRGFDPAGYPTEPLVSYQINRQFSGWNFPPLVTRAVGAHCETLADRVETRSQVRIAQFPSDAGCDEDSLLRFRRHVRINITRQQEAANFHTVCLISATGNGRTATARNSASRP
jgi:hypothetical protein